jgi:hypothetical protein
MLAKTAQATLFFYSNMSNFLNVIYKFESFGYATVGSVSIFSQTSVPRPPKF